ncbi:hypothetical protein [Methylobacterium oxalidis]|uniref:Uncharacterized protein n=1 Tax=Methylobacterium oxalidis TaxID=944322 RepID=A0A512J6M6_9HYPH|nr:hypothetical protein [Methylobacterium oxalidis]GEP05634.1 hypothetical protein MOX02_36720 [Methylobacterium oxalidis]GLS65386.1 hypothetical protein GCM10007888_37680 [Methylobacterium oxalidis]
MSPAELIAAAEMAESIVSEMAAAADALTKKGKAAAVRALLEEARRHTAEAIRLRAQAAALQQRGDARSEDPEHRA